ncbi:hypothetical protein DL93DRAFT_807172 [Clavulina sp. PMI_390]|nr:hypothetical protein DL93DRAFT_807172 [Clavulina sp. PMI_390]
MPVTRSHPHLRQLKYFGILVISRRPWSLHRVGIQMNSLIWGLAGHVHGDLKTTLPSLLHDKKTKNVLIRAKSYSKGPSASSGRHGVVRSPCSLPNVINNIGLCNFSDSIESYLDSSVDSIEIRLQFLSNVSQELEKQRAKLYSIQNSSQPILAILPVEILSYILEIISTRSDDYFLKQRFAGYHLPYRFRLSRSFIMMGLVCRKFRAIALSSPRCWRDILLVFQQNRLIVPLNVVAQRLARSGTTPFNIFISMTGNAQGESAPIRHGNCLLHIFTVANTSLYPVQA